jgi:hypothetical protein
VGRRSSQSLTEENEVGVTEAVEESTGLFCSFGRRQTLEMRAERIG